ncbi:MAG: DUF1570 domain-containing protein [Phycisphaerae bacterium]|nr:DUF1570 domain-containing protein [Phycisphaerae bacterium]
MLVCTFSSLILPSCAPPAPPHAEAATPLEAVVASQPRPNVILSQEPWTYGTSRGVIVRTPSYRLFTTISDETLRQRLPVFLELAGAQYRSAITPLSSPALALDTYVMADRTQWERIVSQLLGSRSDLISSMSRGGFTLNARSILYELGPRDTLVLLAHEGWHQFAQGSFKEPLPIWLDEGLATWFEGHRWSGVVPVFTPSDNPDRLDALIRAARSNTLIPLDQLVSTTPQEWISLGGDRALTYYAQVWALTRFLTEHPTRRDALANILTLASRGQMRAELSRRVGDRAAGIAMSRRLGPAVLESFIDRDQAALQRAYDAFIESLTSPPAR